MEQLTTFRKDRHRSKVAEAESTPTPTPAVIPSHSSGPKIKMELPDFNGEPTEWRHFHRLFTSAMDSRGRDFTQHEKVCILLKSMKIPDAQRILVRQTLERGPVDFTEESFIKLRERFLNPFKAMQECGCDTLSHYLTALACEDFTPRMRDEWTKHISTLARVPNLEDLFAYTQPLEHARSSFSLLPKSTPR